MVSWNVTRPSGVRYRIDSAVEDRPYLLGDPIAVDQRIASVDDPHVQDLNALVRRVRQESGGHVPWFDPWDGGQEARVLFLLEAPGGKAVNFVSMNNPDPTAKQMHDTLSELRLSRKETVSWNIVPWYVGDAERRKIRAVRSDERDVGVAYLRDLLELLPRLEVVVLLGEHARKGWNALAYADDLEVFTSPHPSSRGLALPQRRERFHQTLSAVADRLRHSGPLRRVAVHPSQ